MVERTPPPSAAIDPEELLSPKETAALTYWRASTQAPLDNQFNARLFELYLNGCDCGEIMRLNPTLSLGQIVHAKVKGRWDERKDEHLGKILTETAGRFKQVALESVGFVANMLAASNKLHGDAIKKFLQSGNPSDLGVMRIDSLASYQKAVELLMKLTGQDKASKVEAIVTHRVEGGAVQPLKPAESAGSLKRLRGR